MSIYYNVTDVMKLLECSNRTAYKIIAKLNQELKNDKNVFIRKGKVNKKYFHERLDFPMESGKKSSKTKTKKGKVENETDKKSLQKTG